MADEQESALTVLDECGQEATEELAEDEGEEEKPDDSEPEPEDAEKKGRRKKPRKYDDDDEMDDDVSDDDEEEEERRVNPRLHLIAGPLLFRDLCNLKEFRISTRQSDTFESRLFRMKDKVGMRKPKRGYARFSYKNANMAYWILDTLKGIHIPRARATTIGCWMMNSDTATDIMHNTPDDLDDIKRRLEELEVDDISQRSLHFGNLPRSITEEKLKEFITEAKKIHLPKFRGNPRGYAFVEFESQEQAEECLQSYKSKTIDNSTLTVRKIGCGKTANLLKGHVDFGGQVLRGGRGMRRGRGGRMPRRRSPDRYQGTVWDGWGREDRKRRFPSDEREYIPAKYPRGAGQEDYGRREYYGRRDDRDDWEYHREYRRDYRDRIGHLDELRYHGRREDFSRDDYLGRYDRGYGDAWAGSSPFSRSYSKPYSF